MLQFSAENFAYIPGANFVSLFSVFGKLGSLILKFAKQKISVF